MGIIRGLKGEEMKALVFLFMVFSSLYAMKQEVVIEIIQDQSIGLALLSYYHHDTKELNLSNVQMGDEGLAKIEQELKTFVESVGVERLIIENADLKTIPFNLIGFTLVCKSLQYVSFLGNKFINYASSEASTSIADDTRPRIDSLVAGTITTLWGNLSPEIEKILKAHNSNGSKYHYYNKIIFIDRTMPPITILDTKRAPYTKLERVKYVLVRVGLFGLGVVITFVPSIIPWLLTPSNDSN